MRIVAELSMYPLNDNPIPAIVGFIHDLRGREGLEVVTNQLSTQLRGDFETVTGTVAECMRKAMSSLDKVVVVVKYLNIDLPIASEPFVD
jgi:uncharacterized protein YqgV (UPF0045/DUF77 family)